MDPCNQSLSGRDLFSAPCVLSKDHTGGHVTASGEREEFPGGGESVSQRLDRVFLGVREEIRALTDHMAKEIATVRVSSAIPVYRAPEDERDGNYLHGRAHGDLIRELYQRISKLEDRMSPPTVRGPEPNEDRPCTAVLKLNGYTDRTCDAGSHQGPHRDPASGDTWEQYQEGSVQVSRPRYEELVRRSSQLTALECDDMTLVSRTAWEQYQKDSDGLTALENLQNPVCGHRDPSSGRVCQRPPDHYGEVHSDTPRQFDATVWSTGHSSAEHQAPRETPSED